MRPARSTSRGSFEAVLSRDETEGGGFVGYGLEEAEREEEKRWELM
jgi:hypothetical protein